MNKLGDRIENNYLVNGIGESVLSYKLISEELRFSGKAFSVLIIRLNNEFEIISDALPYCSDTPKHFSGYYEISD